MVWMLAWSDFVGFSLPSFAYMGVSFGKAGTEGVSLMTAFWGWKWCHIYIGYLGTEHELSKFAKCLGAITVLPNEQLSSFFGRCMPATRDADGFLSTCNGGLETFPLGSIMSPSARFRPHFEACPSRRRASTVTLSTRKRKQLGDEGSGVLKVVAYDRRREVEGPEGRDGMSGV